MKKILFLLFIPLFLFNEVLAATVSAKADSAEIYLLDSYIAPEKPTIFHLSFATSEPCKSTLYLDGRNEFVISDTLTDTHEKEIDLSGRKYSGKSVPFYIIAVDSAGEKSKSDIFDLDFPKEITMAKESNFLLLGLFFGAQFLLPTPSYVSTNGVSYFELTKDIPLLSFRSANIDYPAGYFGLEYSHIFNADESNFMRIGYKHFFELPLFKYISPGIDLFTNFSGFTGYSMEVSIGMIDLLNTFTVYSRYRFNSQPSYPERNFHEISIGVFSNYFSFHF
jgi:hypothetical protein